MRAVVQRVGAASVEVGGWVVGAIPRGILALVGIESTDTDSDRRWLAEKLPHLRIFEDAGGKMNLSVLDLALAAATPGGEGTAGILLVPNFTVAGDASKGRRPSFDLAMRPERSEGEFAALVAAVRSVAGPALPVETGVFRADMRVSLINEGPVTIWLDSREPRRGSTTPAS